MEDKKIKEEKTKNNQKISIFKKFIISIKDFDKYGIFINERIGQTLIYILLLVLIFSVVVTVASASALKKQTSDYISKLKEKIYFISYSDEKLDINNNEESNIDLSGYRVIINTNELNNDAIEEYKDNYKEEDYLIVLRDKLIIKSTSTGSEVAEFNYSEFENNNPNEAKIVKKIIESIQNGNYDFINGIVIIIFFVIWLYVFALNTLIDILILALLCYITSKILKVNIKYSSSFNIAAHALTLPILLYLVYEIIVAYTNFNIPYFQLMYYGVAYVYIITALFMIKSDNIKMKIDLQKIKDVQEQIKEELDSNKQEEKDEKEKEDVKKRDKEKEKPEGNNA